MDSIVQRFQNSPLSALEFIKAQSNLTSEQCCEVIELELAEKAACGQPIRLEPYVVGCPIVADSEDSLLKLILAEHRHCPTLPREVALRFPELSGELRRRVEQAMSAIDQAEESANAGVLRTESMVDTLDGENDARCRPEPRGEDSPDDATHAFVPGAFDSSSEDLRDARSCEDLIANDYEVQEMIAQGGMGVVYRARQVSLSREVALKMIRSAALASEDDVRRFQVEAEAAAKLNHPGIVPIYEVGESNGCPFYSMELVEGGSLQQLAGSAKLPPRQAAKLLAAVADAVYFGHERGIIHRDLKPSNILLDASGRPKVTDFGLAKDLGRDQEMTASGALLGTPSYMAPEQAQGRLDAVGPTADIYALGGVLYFLLTGRPPLLGQGFVETIQQVINDTPDSPDRVAADVDRDLATICMKCLEKSPEDRYVTAAELAADLRRWIGHLPILARTPSSLERLRKFVRRRPALSGLTVALGLVVIVASISLTHAWWKMRTAEQSLADKSGRLEQTKSELATATSRSRRLEDIERKRADSERRREYATQIRDAEDAWEAADLKRMRQLLDDTRRGELSKLRGVEWFIHDHRAHADLLTLDTRNPCQQIAINRDGSRLVAITTQAVLWDAESGTRIAEWAVPISNAEFDATGQRVALVETFSDGGSRLRICSAVDGTELVQAKFDEGPIEAIGFFDARVVLAMGANVIVCDADGRDVVKLVGHSGLITDLAVNAAARLAVTTSDDNSVRVWDLQRGVELRRLENAANVACLDIHDEGKLVAGGHGNMVSIWDVQTGKKLKNLTGLKDRIHDVCFGDPLRGVLFTGSEGNLVQAWALDTGRRIWSYKGHERDVLTLSRSGPQAGLIASGSSDCTVKIWSERFPCHRQQLIQETSLPTSIDFSFRGDMLACGMHSGEVHVVSVPDAQEIRRFQTSGGAVRQLRCSPTGSALAIATDSALLLCQMDDEGVKPRVIGEGAASVEFDSQGRLLASAGVDNVVRVHRVDTGALLTSLPQEEAMLTDVALLADGRRVLVSSRAGLTLWAVATGDKLWSLDTEVHIAAIDVRGDGEQVAVASYDGRVKIFDLAQKPSEPVRILAGHSGGLTDVRYSRDGRRLATASDDETVRIWQADDGVELLALPDHRVGALRVAIQPGGRYLASVSKSACFLFGPECRTGHEAVEGRARQRLTQLMERDPEPAVYYRMRALARRAAGDHSGAADDMAEYDQRIGSPDDTLAANRPAPTETVPPSLVARQESRFRKGTEAAERGDYAAALAAYRQAFELAEVDDGWKNAEYAVLLRQAGEERDYQKLCGAFMRRHSQSEYVGRLFMLGEHPQVALESATKSAEEVVLADVQPWHQFMLGAVHFRAGRFARAEDFVRISMKAPDYRVYRWFYLSMILVRRQRANEAREWFEKADRWMILAKEGAPPAEGNGANIRTWSHRLELELLRNEAANMLP